MSHYNHELIALAIAFSYFAALMMLSIINKLNKSLSHDKKALLICSALIIGSSLWAIQLINAFALPSSSDMQSGTSSIAYIALSWLAAFIFAAILLYITVAPPYPPKHSLLAAHWLVPAQVPLYFLVFMPTTQKLP